MARNFVAILIAAGVAFMAFQNYRMADRIATLTAERDIAATYAVACYRQTYKDI